MDDQLHGIVNRLDRIEGSIAIVDSHVGALTAECTGSANDLTGTMKRFDRLEQLLRGGPISIVTVRTGRPGDGSSDPIWSEKQVAQCAAQKIVIRRCARWRGRSWIMWHR